MATEGKEIVESGENLPELTDKQELFCMEYMKDLNKTQAAIRAGYSADSASQIGYDNMKKPAVKARIKQLLDERKDEVLVDAYYVVTMLKRVAERCVQDEKPAMVFNPVTNRMEQAKDADGNNLFVFEAHGAVKAAEALGKHIGLFEKDNTQKAVPFTLNIVPFSPDGKYIPLATNETEVNTNRDERFHDPEAE